MNDKMKLLQAIAVTGELTGSNLSEAAVSVMMSDLSAYPTHSVIAALERCRRDLRGRLTLVEIISRIDDGRPGVEEAWSMIPRDEYKSLVWTNEMVEAWAVAEPLISSGDEVAARMAFKETYQRIVSDAKSKGVMPVWSISLGYDKSGHEPALFAAVEKGRIPASRAMALLQRNKPSNRIIGHLADEDIKMLPKEQEGASDSLEMRRGSPEVAKHVIAKLNELLAKMGG